ncbi:hypothetical protein BU23DRAFT_582790 [Bimuria novae-zelandiae CBS 107.79]|uniref:Uncharacterized protein n=1 Tax=Bimuria novae-zelandiae CBS 107.79 TaxID=1447943 RepID=A0A6A5V7R1_9PLEO|nr:hypothetical protein BU23DRAFT_582790 [Bimuria novae-zelandiae CBS 107.79]
MFYIQVIDKGDSFSNAYIFFSACYFIGTLLPADFSVHLAEYKGSKNYKDNNNNMFIHYISSKDIYSRDVPSSPASQFLIKDQYTRSVYQGILPNTGAANVSTVGKEQYLALIQEDPTVTMDTSTAGKTSIKFGKGSVTVSIGTAQIPTEIGKIDFEVLDTPTPFLLYLADMDRLKVYFNNTTDELVQGNFYLNKRERATAFLTEIELRQLYYCFRHLAIIRLARLLKDASHNNFKEKTLKQIIKSKPTLYIVDLQALRMLWINTYQGLLDILTHNAGTNFIMGVTCKQIERYHAPLHRAWDILYAKLTSTISNKVTNALNTRNGPNTADMLALPLQSEVLV